MGEFGRTSLLMLAASIGSDDHWVMAASSGAVTLTPLRMMSDSERRSAADRSALLRLTDLGYVKDTDEGDATSVASPLSNSIGVLLLPWSLQATVARLDLVARTTTDAIPSCYAPEDWLTTVHYFLDDADWVPADFTSDFATRSNPLPGLIAAGKRHFIYGSLANPTSTQEVEFDLSWYGGASSRSTVAAMRGARVVDPLVFTNPGSVPEGLSPLFVGYKDQSP